MGRRSRRSDDLDERSSSGSPVHRSKRSRQASSPIKGRQYRHSTGEGHKAGAKSGKEQVKVEGDMAARIATRVKQNVEEAMQSEAVEKRIGLRLREERARLEEKVTAQLESEKATLLAKKREQQLERKRKQDELERILQENRLKVEEAQQRAAEERRQRQQDGVVAADLTKIKQRPQGIRVMET